MLYEGCYAHVISRSIRKMRLFGEDEDFDQFKKLLWMAKEAGGFEVYHYCIMQTHFHFAVSPEVTWSVLDAGWIMS